MRDILCDRNYFHSSLWHVHTNYTDGRNTVDEICRYAIAQQYPLLCFTEHIRLNPTYDVCEFLNEVRRAQENYADQLIIRLGFEAKLLIGGGLDIEQKYIEEVDYLFLAEHSYHGDYSDYIHDIQYCMSNNPISVWAHPFLLPYKKKWTVGESDLEQLLSLCKERNIVIEFNTRYSMPPTELKNRIVSDPYLYCLTGVDLHSVKT